MASEGRPNTMHKLCNSCSCAEVRARVVAGQQECSRRAATERQLKALARRCPRSHLGRSARWRTSSGGGKQTWGWTFVATSGAVGLRHKLPPSCEHSLRTGLWQASSTEWSLRIKPVYIKQYIKHAPPTPAKPYSAYTAGLCGRPRARRDANGAPRDERCARRDA